MLMDEDEDIIRILPLVKDTTIKDDKCIVINKNQPVNDAPSDYYYKIVDEETTPSKKYLASERLMAIPVTIPFKVRFGVYEGDDNPTFDANIAYAFGYKMRVNNKPYKKHFMRVLVAFGISSQQYMPKDSVDSKTFEATNKIALTDALGVTYEFADKLNFGVFIGQDWMFGANKNWYYQGKPWIGIGVGFKFE